MNQDIIDQLNIVHNDLSKLQIDILTEPNPLFLKAALGSLLLNVDELLLTFKRYVISHSHD